MESSTKENRFRNSGRRLKSKRSTKFSYDAFNDCIPAWLVDSSTHYVVLLDKKGQMEYSNRLLRSKGVKLRFARTEKFYSYLDQTEVSSNDDFLKLLNDAPSNIHLKLISILSYSDVIPTIWDFRLVRLKGEMKWLGIGRDVESQVLSEEEALGIGVARAIDHGAIFSVADQKGLIIHANDNFCEFTGYSRDELLGKRHMEIVYEHHSLVFWRDMMTQIHNGLPWVKDIKIQTKDGKVRWFHTMVSPVLDSRGNIVKVIHIQYDVTEHKVAEEEKLTLYKKYNKITANLQGFAFQYHLRYNGQGYFPFVTDGVSKLLSLEAKVLESDAGQFFRRILKDDVERIENEMNQSAKLLSPLNTDFRVNSADDWGMWLQFIATPERLSDGSTIWHGFCYDITERKSSEERVQRQKKRLDEIAFIQAHEFRRPVANMLGIFDVIQMEYQESDSIPAPVKEWLSILHDAVKETDAIIGKIVTKTHEEELNEIEDEYISKC